MGAGGTGARLLWWGLGADSLPFLLVVDTQDREEGRVLHQVQPDGPPQDVWWEAGGEAGPSCPAGQLRGWVV